MATYTPATTEIVHTTKVDFRRRPIVEAIHLMQYDSGMPVIAAELYSDGLSYQAPSGSTIKLRFSDRHGATVYSSALGTDSTGHVVYFRVTSEMTQTSGARFPVIELTYGETKACSSDIPILIGSCIKVPNSDDGKYWIFKEGAGVHPSITYITTGSASIYTSYLNLSSGALTNSFTFTIGEKHTKLNADVECVDNIDNINYSLKIQKNGTQFASLPKSTYWHTRLTYASNTTFNAGDTLKITNYFGIWRIYNLWLE